MLEITAEGPTAEPTVINIFLACESLVKVVSQLPGGAALCQFFTTAI